MGLLAGWNAQIWGTQASDASTSSDSLEALRAPHARAIILVEQAWKEVVQLAAESLGWRADGIASGVSDSFSELGEQYKIMRTQLETNIAKLDERSHASHRSGSQQSQPD